jgi:hypothetical protein
MDSIFSDSSREMPNWTSIFKMRADKGTIDP